MSARHVEHVMGTVFSIVAETPDGFPDAVARLHAIDAKFSTYREDSPVSRLARGERVPYDTEIGDVLDHCAEIERATGGAFTAYPAGTLDPSGWVKGWAIEEVCRILREHGSRDHLVIGGGDVQAAGEPEPGRPWNVGIADPLRERSLAAIVSGRDFAVATSGTAERGGHIVDPATGAAADGFASVTLIGERIARTDAFATAVVAMGPARGLEWAERRDGVEAYAVFPDGRTAETSGFSRYLAG